MLGAAVGLGVLGKRAFASTFAAFFTRAYDQIRMAAISNATIHLCGSHAGVSIGEDGPSQMALEDLAMMRAVYGSTVLYPMRRQPDGAARRARWPTCKGISYLRTTREKTPVLYPPGEKFPIGGSKVVRQSGAGPGHRRRRRHHAARGAEGVRHAQGRGHRRPRHRRLLGQADRRARRCAQAAKDTGGKLVVVEDHWLEGGLGDAVLEAFTRRQGALPRVVKLAVREMPGSGTPAELLSAAGIDADAHRQGGEVALELSKNSPSLPYSPCWQGQQSSLPARGAP